MKNLFAILLGCLSLTGCLGYSDPSDHITIDTINESDPAENYPWYRGADGPGYDCNSSFVELKYKKIIYIVQLPSSCDPNPYIYKGDPGPEFWQPIEDVDPYLKESIVKMAIVTKNNNQ